VQLEANRATAAELGFAAGVEAWREANICDLAGFADASFDAVVAYGGPLSYVFDDARDRALDECRRVLVAGGTLAASVMSLWGTVHAVLPQVLRVPAAANARILATGDLTRDVLPESAHQCHMFRAAELRALLERHGLAVTAMSASNALVSGWETALADLEGTAVWAELLAAEEEASRQPGCLDSGTHIIAVAVRP
jgi:SAM-dependent methyltransferase